MTITMALMTRKRTISFLIIPIESAVPDLKTEFLVKFENEQVFGRELLRYLNPLTPDLNI